jgi:hypothetical protein
VGCSDVDFDEDGEHIRRALSYARLAAVPLLLTGLMHGAALVQIVLFAARQSPPVLVAELGFGAMAAAHLLLGYRVYDASYPATLVAVAAALGGAFLAFGWWLVLLVQGTLSFLAMLVCLAGVVSGAACVGLVPLTAASAAARRRLLEG